MKTASMVCGIIGGTIGILFSLMTFIGGMGSSAASDIQVACTFVSLIFLIVALVFSVLQKVNGGVSALIISVCTMMYVGVMTVAIDLSYIVALLVVMTVAILLIASGALRSRCR